MLLAQTGDSQGLLSLEKVVKQYWPLAAFIFLVVAILILLGRAWRAATIAKLDRKIVTTKKAIEAANRLVENLDREHLQASLKMGRVTTNATEIEKLERENPRLFGAPSDSDD